MSQPLCVVDGQPVADQASLCADCGGRLDNALAAIAELAPELETTLTRQSRQAAPAGVRTDETTDPYEGTPYDTIKQQRKETAGAVVQALPFHGGASAVRTELQTAVIGWARHVAEERGQQLPVGGVVEAAAWLRDRDHRHIEWIRHRDEAGEVYRDLMRVRAHLVRVVDIPPHLIYCGKCSACGGDLEAPQGAVRGVCPNTDCRAEYSPAERWSDAMAQAEGMTATAEEISRFARLNGMTVATSTIRGWDTTHHRITRAGQDRRGRVLYHVNEVLDLLVGEAARSGGAGVDSAST